MIKTGITGLSQVKNKNFTTFLNKDKKISITLYQDIHMFPNADNLAERILLLFSDERGAYKRTYQKRFEDFDLSVINILKNLPTPQAFHDCGVSDGRTALDFFEKMVLVFPDIQYFASDYNPSVFVLEKGKLKVTLSHTGKILEILFPPFVFNKIKQDSFRHYPLNHLILFFVEKFWVNSLMQKYKKGLIKAKELLLFSPKVLKKSQKDHRFRLGKHDLLHPFKERVDVVRAMNVLNPSYFSDVEFSQVIYNIYEGLNQNGLLITGSNQEAGTIVNGGIYQKKEKGFKKIFNSGEGSPIEAPLLDFKF
jgi:hypothetical protein